MYGAITQVYKDVEMKPFFKGEPSFSTQQMSSDYPWFI